MFRKSLIIGLMAIATACTSSSDNDIATPKAVEIQTESQSVEIERSVTLNVVTNGLQLPIQASWSVNDGEGSLDTSNGSTVVYTAPKKIGDFDLTVTVLSGSLVVTESITMSVVLPNTLRPATPTDITLVSGDNMITISWKANTESILGGYTIYYSDVSNSSYNSLDVGNVTTYQLKNLENQIPYYIRVSAYSKAAGGSSSKESDPSDEYSKIPKDLGPPEAPLAFQADVSGNVAVALSWINPTSADFVGVKIRRKTVDYPISENDGTLIYDGNLEDFTDGLNVAKGSFYYYSIFAYDDIPAYSIPAKAVIFIPNN